MKHILGFAAIFAVFVFFARREVFTWPYYYDEADYMFAASLGWANYTDQASQSLSDYIRTGVNDGGDPARRSILSARSRGGADPNFYRHWHGPLYFYWLSALAPLHLDEPATRSLSYIFPALTALVIYFGSLWLFPAGVGGLAAVLSSAFYLWSYATVFSNEIAPHQLFVLCAVTALIFLMKWRATGEPRAWYGAVIASACAFCTLEVAFVLVAVIAVCGFTQTANDRHRIGKSILAFLATVLFLWPAALLKFSFAKAYLFMAYLALMRKSPWGDGGVFETWKLRLMQSPWEWLLLGLAVILYLRFCDSALRKMLLPVMLYGVLMLVVLLRVNSETPRYMLPFLPAFQIGAGIIFASVLKNRKPALRFAAAAAILCLLFWNTYSQLRAHPILPAPRLAEVIARVRDQKLESHRLLAPQNDLPMIHYYLPGVMVSGYASERERAVMLAQDNFDAVLYPGYPISLQRQSSVSPHYLSQR